MVSLLFSCGGGGSSSTNTEFTAGADAAPRGFSGIDETQPAPKDWATRLRTEGTPGVDYDPNFITVGYRSGVTLPAHLLPPAGASQAAQLPSAELRVNPGFEVFTDSIAQRYGLEIASQIYFDVLNIAAFKLPEGMDGDQLLAQINTDYAGVIKYASYSQLMHKQASVQDQWYNLSSGDPPSNYWNGAHPQWGQKRIGCAVAHPGPGQGAWDFTFGSPTIKIADCDTGVNINHSALVDSVLDPTVDFPSQKLNVSPFNPSNHNNNVTDNDGHGTFIAGLIGGKADSVNIIGVAPNCRIVPVKISDGGSTPDFNMYEGCVLAVTPAVGCRVVNLSWGGSADTQTLRDLVTAVNNTGALLVVAAGNEGDAGNPTQYPGAYAGSFCIGSSTRVDSRSSFSNFGSHLDLCAPGEYLASCDAADNNGFYLANGTSFSAPIVASVAGLMLSVKPSLSSADIRQIMTDTGVATSGWNSTVPRLNAAAAVAAAAGLQVQPARVPQLITSGTVQLTPDIQGSADSVECYLDGVLIDTKTSAPWTFSIDTSAIPFGIASVEFRGFSGAEMRSATTQLAVDNSGTVYPVLDGFELAGGSFLPYDAKVLAQPVLDALYNLPGGDKTVADFMSDGAGNWRSQVGGAFKGTGLMGCVGNSGSHSAFEIDALISRKIQVPVVNPSVVFYHKYNLEKGGANQGFDRGWLFVTTDGGQTFTPAKLKNGTTDAWWSGMQASWWKAEVNLSAYAGQTVSLVFCLQTDAAVAGQDTGQPAGWWIDEVTIASDFNESIPLIDGVKVNGVVHAGVNLDALSVFGQVPDRLEMDLEIVQPTNVAEVTYIVDILPYGAFDPGKDLKVEVTGAAPWSVQVNLPATLDNQLANLRVQYVDDNDVAGPEVTVPVWIFNQPGDVNGDGSVNQADLNAFPAAVGSKADDPGFIPFFDTDVDGVVRENDAAAIGYFWGS